MAISTGFPGTLTISTKQRKLWLSEDGGQAVGVVRHETVEGGDILVHQPEGTVAAVAGECHRLRSMSSHSSVAKTLSAIASS